jgi:hypothetical protein
MKKYFAFYIPILLGFILNACKSGSNTSPISSVNDPNVNVGKAGSMARFALLGNSLYVLDKNFLNTFDLTDPKKPFVAQTTDLRNNGIETIFPYQNLLFLGTQTGMLVVDPLHETGLRIISTFNHARACDPVVVHDSISYVTLRDGRDCLGAVNQLDVIKVKDFSRPQFIRSIPMKNPHGLGVSGKWLFVCEGRFGFSVFDISNPESPELRESYINHHGFDVIALKDYVLVVGNDGLYQYGFDPFSNRPSLFLMSRIPSVKR